MKIATLSVKHSAILSMILIALAVFGMFSITTTNLEFIPDIDMPQIFVIAVYPGASAEDVEKDVVEILEDDFVTLPDFKSMDSQSMNSAAMITITFQDGVNPEDQLNEVRNRISQLMPSLPDGLQGEPTAIIGGAFLSCPSGYNLLYILPHFLNISMIRCVLSLRGFVVSRQFLYAALLSRRSPFI